MKNEAIDDLRIRFPRFANWLILLLGIAGFAKLAPTLSKHLVVFLVCVGLSVFALVLWSPALTVIVCLTVTAFMLIRLKRRNDELERITREYEKKLDDEIPF